jgi:hypothetical protein
MERFLDAIGYAVEGSADKPYIYARGTIVKYNADLDEICLMSVNHSDYSEGFRYTWVPAKDVTINVKIADLWTK